MNWVQKPVRPTATVAAPAPSWGHRGSVANGVAGFDRAGRSLYLLTDEGAEFSHLVRYDMATGRRATVFNPKWDVMFATVSDGGRYLVAGVNSDARTELRLFDAATMHLLTRAHARQKQ